MDNYIDRFHAETDKISNDYSNGTIPYIFAMQHLQDAGKQLISHFPHQIPHTIVEELFDAFSELQVQAYEQKNITMEATIASIETMSLHLLGSIKTPTEITQAIIPYKQQIGAPATFADISFDPLCGVPHLN